MLWLCGRKRHKRRQSRFFICVLSAKMLKFIDYVYLVIEGRKQMARNSNKSVIFLVVMVIIGLVIGGFLGSFVGKYIPALSYGYDLGVSTHTWDLGVLKFTFGFMLNVNMFSVIGIFLAYFLYRKL